MKKSLSAIITCIVAISGIITLLLFFGIIQEFYYRNKFKETTTPLNNSEFLKKWGDANHVLNNKKNKARTLIYYKGILGINAYIFMFDKNNKLTDKYIDD